MALDPPQCGAWRTFNQMARIWLFFALCSTSASPRASSSGGMYILNRPRSHLLEAIPSAISTSVALAGSVDMCHP